MFTEKQQKDIIQKYTDEMEIIKLRIDQIITITGKIPYLEPTVEYKALQLRKVIEQILLASLVANADEYQRLYNKLGKEWNARLICRDIERINPDFFPRAAINKPEEMKIDDDPNSMTSDELLSIYEKMGKLLHSKNPFASPIDYSAESAFIDDSCTKIIRFLSVHTIHLIGGDAFLFVVMKATNHEGRVAINWFEKCDEEETRRYMETQHLGGHHA